jgi:hypothetical protein
MLYTIARPESHGPTEFLTVVLDDVSVRLARGESAEIEYDFSTPRGERSKIDLERQGYEIVPAVLSGEVEQDEDESEDGEP